MRFKHGAVALVCMLLVSPILTPNSLVGTVSAQTSPDVYVGVDMAYGDAVTAPSAARALIDEVSPYTNLFVVGTTAISASSVTLNETLQYAYDKGLSFMSLMPNRFDFPQSINLSTYDSLLAQWFKNDKDAWGDKLLGFLCPSQDEPGGKQLDLAIGRFIALTNVPDSPGYVSNYTDATAEFENDISGQLAANSRGVNRTVLPLFTSDYALYWFDYKGGYDGLFAELGWNYSSQLTMALCRGAAQAQNKQWGVIFTYTYNVTSYLESGPKLYEDMVYAYNSGAKYIVIFDANENYTQDILQHEHLQAMQQFWNYAKVHPRDSTPASGRTALVLPYGYAYGFRGPYDKIWGLWAADTFPQNMTAIVYNALEKYGDKLDVVYDDGLQLGNTWGYSQLVYWNASDLAPTPTPSPSQQPTSMPYVYAALAVAVCLVAAGIVIVLRRRFRGNTNSA